MRRLLMILLALACLAPAAARAAAADTPAPAPHVDVVQVSGLIDRVEADFIARSLATADRRGAAVLVLQLNSRGGTISAGDTAALVDKVRGAATPVAVWVGQSGAKAIGPAFDLLKAADFSGYAPKVRVGPPGAAEPVKVTAPTLVSFLGALDGKTLRGRTLHIVKTVRTSSGPRQEPAVDVRFAKLTLFSQLMHTAASPSVAYLLTLIGLILMVLEFFTAGIGVAAVTGAACLALGGYGLAALHARPLGVALLVLAVFGYAVDLQAGAPRFWTVVGAISSAVAAVLLFDHVHPSLLADLVGVGGLALFMVAGMPSMVRARFSTPTIGRGSMIGEMGTAVGAVSPEGTVEVRGAPWRARTNRATPIESGAAIRVIGIDGLLLEVEPETGGARDHRHRA
jgi:membrane-bound serine protease (ClpP class)